MKTTIALMMLAFAVQAGAQATESTKTFTGGGFEVTGDLQTTPVGRQTMREGKIVFEGKQYKIVTASLYGNIGAVSTVEGERGKRFMFFTSSFGELANGRPSMVAQSYTGCEGTYNAVAVIYDVEGVNVTDSDGTVLNLASASDVKKKLFPALISNPNNSRWSAGHCVTLTAQ